MRERYLAGGYGYGDSKKALTAKIEEHFAEARVKRAAFDKDPSFVEDVLRDGARRVDVAGPVCESADTLARDGFCVVPRLLDAAACRAAQAG